MDEKKNMPENDGKNGTKNGEETTDKPKLFCKGGAPGPGRGHKKETSVVELDGSPLTFADIENYLRPDLQNTDPAVRHRAARLLIAIKHKVPDPASDVVLDPDVFAWMRDKADSVCTIDADYEESDEEGVGEEDDDEYL